MPPGPRPAPQDYINFHLTGRMVASITNASVRWHYSTTGGGWPTSLLDKLGLAELLGKWPQEVLALGEWHTPGMQSSSWRKFSRGNQLHVLLRAPRSPFLHTPHQQALLCKLQARWWAA